MESRIDKLIQTIQSLASVDETERAMLMNEVQKIEKTLDRKDFVLKRMEKDRSIAINILQSTIEDMQKQKNALEDANLRLKAQQEELQYKNQIIKEKSRSLRENLHMLEQSYHEMEQFSYIASHDLKSPLRTIASFAQLLSRRYNKHLGEEADEYIDYIVAGVRHMNEVIESLLEYSKIGNASSDMELIDLNEVLRIVRFNLKKELEDQYVIINVNELPTIPGNKIALVQLFQNLIHNSIKFRTVRTPVIDIKFRFIEVEQQWEFSLSDNGVGIDPSYASKIFQPFQRLDTENVPGLGMGLAICRKAVKLHHGNISCTSNQTEGTTFTFTLAALQNAPLVDKAM